MSMVMVNYYHQLKHAHNLVPNLYFIKISMYKSIERFSRDSTINEWISSNFIKLSKSLLIERLLRDSTINEWIGSNFIKLWKSLLLVYHVILLML